MTLDDLKCGLYEHYKGGTYQVLGIGEHTETKEKCVVYLSLTLLPGPRIRIRPAEMFFEEVEWPDGKKAPRFRWIGHEPPPSLS